MTTKDKASKAKVGPEPIGRPTKELKHVPSGETPTVIQIGENTVDLNDAVNLPSDRLFRDAWQLDAEAIEIDMPAARAIKRQQLREERQPILAGLDIDWMRASEQGDSSRASKIAALKQKYRDAINHPAIRYRSWQRLLLLPWAGHTSC